MRTLLDAAAAWSYPRPEQFPDPVRYYRGAKPLLLPDTRPRELAGTVLRAVDELTRQRVFPPVPWLYVQLVAVAAWKLDALYLATAIRVNRKSFARWEEAKDAKGVKSLWREAARGLPAFDAARRAVSDYMDAFNNPDAPPRLPEPDDAWSLRERTWFTKSVACRVACAMASRGGLSPGDFPADATPDDVARAMARRMRVRVIRTRPAADRARDEQRPAFLGRVWRPLAG